MSLDHQNAAGISLPGFTNPIFDATEVFRKVLAAMSRPGEMQSIKKLCAFPDSLNSSSAAILLALADMETEVWLAPEMDSPQARDFLKFHTGCRVIETPEDCMFAIVNTQTDLAIFNKLPIGTSEYPDRSATLVMAVENIESEPGVTLKGPGIKVSHDLRIADVTTDFWRWFEQNTQLFPCGIDVIFASEDHIAAVPRSIKAEFSLCM